MPYAVPFPQPEAYPIQIAAPSLAAATNAFNQVQFANRAGQTADQERYLNSMVQPFNSLQLMRARQAVEDERHNEEQAQQYDRWADTMAFKQRELEVENRRRSKEAADELALRRNALAAQSFMKAQEIAQRDAAAQMRWGAEQDKAEEDARQRAIAEQYDMLKTDAYNPAVPDRDWNQSVIQGMNSGLSAPAIRAIVNARNQFKQETLDTLATHEAYVNQANRLLQRQAQAPDADPQVIAENMMAKDKNLIAVADYDPNSMQFVLRGRKPAFWQPPQPRQLSPFMSPASGQFDEARFPTPTPAAAPTAIPRSNAGARTIVQNGNLFTVYPDGTSKYVGPANP